MKINFYWQVESELHIPKELTRKFLQNILEAERKILGEINFIFTTNSDILELNKDYLQHYYYTDVITFNNNLRDKIIGDIFISIDQVTLNSKRFSTATKDELLRVIIHGLLHLIGYNDQTAEEKSLMTVKENIYLDLWKKGYTDG